MKNDHIIVQNYLKNHSLVESNIISFNNFLEHRMQEIVDEINNSIENDDFEMIDLDTGEPLSSQLNREEDIEDEKRALREGLDEAFSKLTGEKLEDELSFKEGPIQEMEEELEKKLEEATDLAKDLDLDLDFLNDTKH